MGSDAVLTFDELFVCRFKRIQYGFGFGRGRHCACFVVTSIADVWTIPPKFFQEADDFGGLLFAENTDLQIELITAVRQPVRAPLRRQDERRHAYGHEGEDTNKPNERGRIKRRVSVQRQEQIYADPNGHEERE